MLQRGCTVAVAVLGALFALYLGFFTRYFEWPGNLFAAGFGAFSAGVGVGAVGHIIWAWRDSRAFARAARGEAPVDGRLVVAAGPIRPLGVPLTSPFWGKPCVAYEYEVFGRRRRRTEADQYDLAGFAMAASAIETSHGGVRLLGFPILDHFPQSQAHGPEARTRGEPYVASASFEQMQGLGKLKMFSAFDDALADADGIVRKDFRLDDGAVPLERRTIGERIVEVGEQVCAVGRYDAEKRALVAKGATLNRLWPGTPDTVRRKIMATGRSQARFGLAFFAVIHAMLGAAFYLSETRHAREPENRQAMAIRQAVQDHDIEALERAVRRGANPNARDSFGNFVLLDVRDPEIAAALIRLGADVNISDDRDGDTPLIRAARMGNVALVRVLLAGGASVRAETTGGATALSEAVRGGHDEVARLLREAAASGDLIERERPRPRETPLPGGR